MNTTLHSCDRVKAIAFTLAETLIVIGVIGIVSALTLPNLNSSTGDKELVAKVKKIHQNLNDAYGRAEAVYGPKDDWFVNDGDNAEVKAKRAGERITEFMKISKNCGIGTGGGCFKNGNVKNLAGADDITAFGNLESESYKNWYKVIASDGTSIAFGPTGSAILVDIDGPSKGPNVTGKDWFRFIYDETEGISPPNNTLPFATLKNVICAHKGGQFGATWILRYDNADYLEFAVASDRKCKNGNEPTEDNPRCK